MPLQQRAVDYHCHILPGLDDGPAEKDISVTMARLLFQVGYREVYCTPHLIKGMYEASNAEVIHARDNLQRELDQEGIPIKLLLGREYYLDEFLLELLKEPQPLEGTKNIMIEIPSHVSVDMVKETLYAICRKGYTPIIAHPERCRLLEMADHTSIRTGHWKLWSFRNRDLSHEKDSSNELLGYLRQLGCNFQANLGSLHGQYGSHIRSNARNFEKAGIFTHAGTDAHSPDTISEILGVR
jgi:protein-tyrosine phosphatase